MSTHPKIQKAPIKGKPAYRRLVHEIRCAMHSYCENLISGIESAADDRKTRSIVYLEIGKAQDKAVIDRFDELVGKFFPDSDAEVIEDLPSV